MKKNTGWNSEKYNAPTIRRFVNDMKRSAGYWRALTGRKPGSQPDIKASVLFAEKDKKSC